MKTPFPMRVQLAKTTSEVALFCAKALRHKLFLEHHMLERWFYKIIQNLRYELPVKETSKAKIALIYYDDGDSSNPPFGVALLCSRHVAVFVKPQFRQLGAGTKMVEALKREYPETFKKCIHGAGTKKGKAFFKKLGVRNSFLAKKISE